MNRKIVFRDEKKGCHREKLGIRRRIHRGEKS
jgi:hypothetical protein